MTDRLDKIRKRANKISSRLLYTKGYDDEHAFNLACRDRNDLLDMINDITKLTVHYGFLTGQKRAQYYYLKKDIDKAMGEVCLEGAE